MQVSYWLKVAGLPQPKPEKQPSALCMFSRCTFPFRVVQLNPIQKYVLHQCNVSAKPAIITRVMDTMQQWPRPTRAEATDVANAVLDGQWPS